MIDKYRTHDKVDISPPIKCYTQTYDNKNKIFINKKIVLIRSCGLNHNNKLLFLAKDEKNKIIPITEDKIKI